MCRCYRPHEDAANIKGTTPTVPHAVLSSAKLRQTLRRRRLINGKLLIDLKVTNRLRFLASLICNRSNPNFIQFFVKGKSYPLQQLPTDNVAVIIVTNVKRLFLMTALSINLLNFSSAGFLL